MNFTQAVQYLLSLGNEVSAMKLGLENVIKLLDALDNPQKNYLKVQVAGTNGKGSVCAFLDSICIKAGINTGRFTSPHLVSITERVKISGADISEANFARHARTVRETSERLLADGVLDSVPTYFEQVTAIALLAFAEAGVELAILETGLGGRLDATTAANAEIAAITRIDYDHQEYLGDTIQEIAAEKAAIIRECTRAAVIGTQMHQAPLKTILSRCRKVGIEPMIAGRDAPTNTGGDTSVSGCVNSDKETHSLTVVFPPVGLLGRHQIENAEVALLAAKELRFKFRIGDTHIADGLRLARHPGRLEYVGDKYLLDGAHNIAGTKALTEFLDEFERRPVTMIYGTMRDKDVGEIAKILFPKAAHLILTMPENSRAMPAAELATHTADMSNVHVADGIADALVVANTLVGDGIILITGSLYLVGEAKKILQNDFET